jgi:hypothetical protein
VLLLLLLGGPALGQRHTLLPPSRATTTHTHTHACPHDPRPRTALIPSLPSPTPTPSSPPYFQTSTHHPPSLWETSLIHCETNTATAGQTNIPFLPNTFAPHPHSFWMPSAPSLSYRNFITTIAAAPALALRIADQPARPERQ